MMLKRVHHIAIICSDYQRSKHFYTQVLGLTIVHELYREDRRSYKLDLAVNGQYQIELFSSPNPPKRVNNPEAAGLRHLAFEVEDLEEAIDNLKKHGIEVETVRVDPVTYKLFTFFKDPDDLPLELCES